MHSVRRLVSVLADAARVYYEDGGCPICARETSGGRLCAACETALGLARLPQPAFVLQRPNGRTHAGNAVQNTEPLDCRSVYAYESDAVRKLLFYLKEYPDRRIVQEFAARLCEILPDSRKADRTLYVNIPRSAAGMRKYGFDQAALLASTAARLLDRSGTLAKGGTKAAVPAVYFADLLAVRPFGKVQKALTARERAANKSGRLYVRPFFRHLPWVPRHIVITDDVITTGSSVLAAAETLHKCFPNAEISALSLAVVTRFRFDEPLEDLLN